MSKRRARILAFGVAARLLREACGDPAARWRREFVDADGPIEVALAEIAIELSKRRGRLYDNFRRAVLRKSQEFHAEPAPGVAARLRVVWPEDS